MVVSFCVNSDSGLFTGRVVEIQIGEDIHLAAPHDRGFVCRQFDRAVKVGRYQYPCGEWSSHVGNVYWDSCSMHLSHARDLVARLIRDGWVVEQWSEGPFEDLVAR